MIDWSRCARNKRKLVKAAESQGQTLITSYYSIIDNIEYLSKENKKLADTIQYLRVHDQQSTSTENPSFGPVLKCIIINAEKNASKLPTGRRHPEILKKFSTALFIFDGPLAYEFIQQNLPQALYLACVQSKLLYTPSIVQ